MPQVQQNSCVDRNFYVQLLPGTGFEEARAITLGKFVENETQSAQLESIQAHLKRCGCCTQFVEDLTAFDLAAHLGDSIPTAVCPSSEALDSYLFAPDKLSVTERNKIEKHLRECPLCRQESEWARDLEGPGLQIPAQPVSWMQYGWIAAAVTMLVLSAALLWNGQQFSGAPDDQLRALAVMKSPDDINFDSLNRALPQTPATVTARYDQGVSAFKQHDYQQASQKFEEVLKMSPAHSAALYLLGYSYYMMNQPQKAYALCDQAERMKPHSYERCMSLVNLALKTGHYGRAIQEISSLYHEAPDHPEIRRMYFRIMSLARGRQFTM